LQPKSIGGTFGEVELVCDVDLRLAVELVVAGLLDHLDRVVVPTAIFATSDAAADGESVSIPTEGCEQRSKASCPSGSAGAASIV
jgi:hypothetical protein